MCKARLLSPPCRPASRRSVHGNVWPEAPSRSCAQGQLGPPGSTVRLHVLWSYRNNFPVSHLVCLCYLPSAPRTGKESKSASPLSSSEASHVPAGTRRGTRTQPRCRPPVHPMAALPGPVHRWAGGHPLPALLTSVGVTSQTHQCRWCMNLFVVECLGLLPGLHNMTGVTHHATTMWSPLQQ